MAETIGELAVSLIGRMDQLQATLNQAKTDIAGLRGKVEEENTKTSASWGRLAVGALAAYGTIKAAALGAVESTKSYALEIDNLRDVTGLEEKEASKLVAQLKHFGVEAGLAANTAFLLSSRASAGSESFEKLGIKTREANGEIKAGGVLFTEVVEALRNETNETTRNSLAKELLGRSAVRLTDFLKANNSEIKSINANAAKMGLIMGKDAVDAYEELSFAQNDLKLAITGLVKVFGDALLPRVREAISGITAFIIKARDWAANNKDLILTVVDMGAKLLLLLGTVAAVAKAITLYQSAALLASTAMKVFSGATVAANIATSALLLKVAVLLSVFLAAYEITARLTKAYFNYGLTIGDLIDKAKAQVASLTEEKKAHEDAGEAAKKHGEDLQELSKQERDLIIQTAKLQGDERIAFELGLKEKLASLQRAGIKASLIEKFELAERGKFNKEYRDQKQENEKKLAETELAGLQKSTEWHQTNMDGKLAMLASYKEAYNTNTAERQVFEDAYREYSRAADDKRNNEIIGSLTTIRDKTADVMTDAVTGAKTWQEAWKELGDYIVRDFINTVLKMLINQIIMAIAKAIALKAIMMAFGGGGVGTGTIFGGMLMGKAAEGGVVTSPTPLWVGEGGEPEAIIPLSKLEQMMAGGGKAGVHIENFNFEHKPGMSFGTPAEMRKAAIQIRYGLQRIGT